MTWQPIETAPKDGTWLLLGQFSDSDTDDYCHGVAHWHDGGWTDGYQPDWYWRGAFEPTHWQPLPEPPEQSA